ncbi:hypothetical protein SYNTR_1844 [Candidatus Syntrophocurvum alkaliphilum]|uniref:Flagellar protein n=1 Tax=Candidatus Syntrophocurvum alkaliphilum TaxID=2293317 RepID=A0A6I6DN75_9FIRM|nr:TIGR03826 family flagellar region protein [Candidatus Syntrophocurvum alkaliphilum]QGU00438.1 hypothetical protein SYNTR_1844 [Candidatus Syntrophocurvum alkaliphilum]
MADLRNCQECGRLFAYQGKNRCRKCQENEEEEYLIVRRYIREHPGASVFETSEATDVEEEKILQFLRDGRLQSRGFKNVLECVSCGQKISQGRFCDNCTNQLAADFQKVAQPKKPRKQEPEPKRRQTDRIYTRGKDEG